MRSKDELLSVLFTFPGHDDSIESLLNDWKATAALERFIRNHWGA